MFFYDDDDLRAIVAKSPDSQLSRKSKRAPCHFRTIGLIAMMMRKFERASSNNHKHSLKYVFDVETSITELRLETSDSKIATSTRLNNVLFYIRKFDLSWIHILDVDPNLWQSAIDCLKSSHADPQVAYLFALVLKYLFRNSREIKVPWQVLNPQDIAELTKKTKDSKVASELVWTLGYMIANVHVGSSENSDFVNLSKLNEDIKMILCNCGVVDEAKAFLVCQMEAFKSKICTFSLKNEGCI